MRDIGGTRGGFVVGVRAGVGVVGVRVGVTAAAADRESLGEDVRELAREVVAVLEELLLMVLVEDVPVLACVPLVLLHPELRTTEAREQG